MKTKIDVPTLLVNRNMWAGEILEEISSDTIRDSIQKLSKAIGMFSKGISEPYVLLCKEHMKNKILENMSHIMSITTDELLLGVEPSELMCVVTDEKEFPEHYIVLTDGHQLKEFIEGGSTPNSGLIAVKGFVIPKKDKSTFKPYSSDDPSNLAWDIIEVIANNEFKEGVHNPPTKIIVHSSFMHLSLVKEGLVNDRMFLGIVQVKAVYNEEKSADIRIDFRDGASVTLTTADRYDKLSGEEMESNASLSEKGFHDMRDIVLQGEFGK